LINLILLHPFILAGQIATIYYFSHFLIILPISGIVDNVLGIIGTTYCESNKAVVKEDVNLSRYPFRIRKF